MASGFLVSYSAFAFEWIAFFAYLLLANRLKSAQTLVLWIVTTILALVALIFPVAFLARHPEQIANAHPFVLALLFLAPGMPIIFAVKACARLK